MAIDPRIPAFGPAPRLIPATGPAPFFATNGITTFSNMPAPTRRSPYRALKIALITLGLIIMTPLLAAMLIGFSRAAMMPATPAPAPKPITTCQGDVAAFNDGWNTALYGDGIPKK